MNRNSRLTGLGLAALAAFVISGTAAAEEVNVYAAARDNLKNPPRELTDLAIRMAQQTRLTAVEALARERLAAITTAR